MSRWERSGERDLSFSHWHRCTFGDDGSMIDLDGIGYCNRCKAPLYVIEATRWSGRPKTSTVATRVAQLVNAPAWVVYYISSGPCECGEAGVLPSCSHGITGLYVERSWPAPTPRTAVSAGSFAATLQAIRDSHAATVCASLADLGLVASRGIAS